MEPCVRCKVKVHTNPHVRMLASLCRHVYCDTCYTTMFHGQDRIKCLWPTCNTPLGPSDFSGVQLGRLAEKEVRIRKNLANVYNMRREDFPTLKEYNDYLEEVEDIVFNLLHNIDTGATQTKIDTFRSSHAAIIEKNKQIWQQEAAQEAREIRMKDEVQRRLREALRNAELAEAAERRRRQERLLAEMEKGELQAKDLASRHSALAKQSQAALERIKPTLQSITSQVQQEEEEEPNDGNSGVRTRGVADPDDGAHSSSSSSKRARLEAATADSLTWQGDAIATATVTALSNLPKPVGMSATDLSLMETVPQVMQGFTGTPRTKAARNKLLTASKGAGYSRALETAKSLELAFAGLCVWPPDE